MLRFFVSVFQVTWTVEIYLKWFLELEIWGLGGTSGLCAA